MVAILVPVAMSTLDTVITNTALPTIAKTLGTDEASSIWIVNAYQLAMVAMLLPFAALAEVVSYRRLYLWGLVLFTATSLACGLAWSLESLVVARVLQGIGAAALMSVNTALVRFIYPLNRLGRGLGLNAMTSGVAFTAGPTVASLVLLVASWHWLFLVNVPLGLIALYLAWRYLPVTKRASHRFDPVAAVLCAGFFGLMILCVGSFSHQVNWVAVAAEGAGSLVCMGLLIRRQQGHPAPMLALDLFRLPVFALSALTGVCAFAVQGLAFVALPFLLQNSLGLSQTATGFLMTPWPAIVALLAPMTGRLSDRYAPGTLGGIGLLILVSGMALLALLPAQPSNADILWRMLWCGVGFGMFQAPNLKALMSSAPPSRSGGASGIVATVRLTGQTLGAASVALCFHLSLARGPEIALWLGCALAATGCAASFLRLLPGWRRA